MIDKTMNVAPFSFIFAFLKWTKIGATQYRDIFYCARAGSTSRCL